LREIAFYLPQYHSIPENDEWWGKGFTEWTNVTRARPVVSGHYQPRLPADLGFYDLRLPEARASQAELAIEYGIDAFCYYHYWFTGRQVLNRPFDEVLSSGEPKFPFCLCWANENWTRAWDGGSRQRLLEQRYSDDDDLAHIQHVLPAVAEARYVRVGGRPLFLVYRTELLPDPRRTADTWRNAAVKAGIGDLYLVRVESFVADVDPASIGFDAAVEFAPDWRRMQSPFSWRLRRWLSRLGLYPKGFNRHRFARYDYLIEKMLAKPDPDFRRIRCVTPGFDNSPRRKHDALILLGSTPQRYEEWLQKVLETESRRPIPEDEKLVFVNAWNEWGEGNHLEPCQRWGREFLEANARARKQAGC